MDPSILPASFFSALVGAVFGKTLERIVVRHHDSQDLTRDFLVDLTSHLTAVESALRGLLVSENPRQYADLRTTFSGSSLQPPAIKLERLLGVFGEDRIHHSVIKFYERHDRFVQQAQQHEDAYYWLLDNPDVKWDTPQAGERVDRIAETRSRMRSHARDMLREGYELVELLSLKAKGIGLNTLLRSTSAEDFLATRLGLTPVAVRQRRAFHALLDYSFEFHPGWLPTFVVWEDDAARHAQLNKGRLTCVVHYVDENGEARQGEIAIPPLREVALPSASRFVSGRVWWPGVPNQGYEMRELPSGRVDQLPNYGDMQRLLHLGPTDMGMLLPKLTAKRIVPALRSPGSG